MRSSKSRSRSKSNRSRSMGNIVNRVFDSSGPEGKVRGTPQQVIDKYTQLARDAQLSNDRVATESFQQHAEHYTRMLGEAQREAEARREQQEGGRDRGDEAKQANGADRDAEAGSERATGGAEDAAVADTPGESDDEGESGLVETPEAKPAPKKRSRKPKAKSEDGSDGDEGESGGDPSSAAAE